MPTRTAPWPTRATRAGRSAVASPPVLSDAARAKVAAARVGRLATVDPGGDPHVVPFCFVLDGTTLWWAVDAKPKSTLALRRLDHVRAHPTVEAVVDHYDDEDWSALWWVRLRGEARVVERDERAQALLAAKYPQYRVAPPPGPLVAIALTRVREWSASPGEPPPG